MLQKFSDLFFYSNNIHFLKELQKTDGMEKINNFKHVLNEKEFFTLKFLYVLIFLLVIQIIFRNFFYSQIFIICDMFLLFLSLTNILAVLFTRYYLNFYIKSFITYCNSIVKFEDIAKVIMKIKLIDNIHLNESLAKITKHYERNSERNPNENLNNENNSTTDNKFLWDQYLRNKYINFNSIFENFENNFVTGENKKLLVSFLTDIYRMHKLSRRTESLCNLYDSSYNLIKEKYSNFKLFEKNDDSDETKIIVDKICENLHVSTEDKNPDEITLNMMRNLNKIVENILEISQNGTGNSQYFDLIELILKIRFNHKDAEKFIQTKEKILENFEIILEKNNGIINVLKQIRLNFQNSIEPIKIEQNKEESERIILEKNNSNKNRQNPSLIELELPRSHSQQNENSSKKQMNSVSHFEIIKHEDDMRRLQMFLLSDLEEFQKNKVKLESNKEAIDDEGITLASVLD